MRELIDVDLTGLKAQYDNLLNLVFGDLDDSGEDGCVESNDLVVGVGFGEDFGHLVNKSLDSFLAELPAAMEDAHRAILTEERQHCISLRLQCRLDVDVAQSLARIRCLRASDATLEVVFVDCVEVYGLVQERGRHWLLVDVLRFENLPLIGTAFRAADGNELCWRLA